MEQQSQEKRVYRVLILISIAGPVIFWLVLVALDFLNPGFNSIRDSLSALAFSDFGWLQRISFILLGLVMIAFGLALRYGLNSSRSVNIVTVIYYFVGAGLIITGIFQADFPSQVHISFIALVHQVGASVALAGMPISALILYPVMRRKPEWRGLAGFNLGSAIFMLLMESAREVLIPGHWMDSWFGLFERILLLIITVWLEVISMRLLYLYNFWNSRKARK